MASKKQDTPGEAVAQEFETIEIRIPRPVFEKMERIAHVSGATFAQVVISALEAGEVQK